MFCAEEACCLPEEMVPWNRQGGDGRVSPVAPPVGLYIKRCRVHVKLKINELNPKPKMKMKLANRCRTDKMETLGDSEKF